MTLKREDIFNFSNRNIREKLSLLEPCMNLQNRSFIREIKDDQISVSHIYAGRKG